MSRIYRKPPLVEALCEFHFASESWDLTIPGLVYQEIKNEFPKKRQMNLVEVEFQAQPTSVSQRLKGSGDRMQFLSDDETTLVQVGHNMLVVNKLQPYSNWATFKTLVFQMLSVYQRVAQPSAFGQLGLRYINRIEIPGSGFNFSDYFNLQPQVPPAIPQGFNSLFMRAEIPYVSDNAMLLLMMGTAPDAKPETSTLILDLALVSTAANELNGETAQSWIETAHGQIETAFEACLTDASRRIFEEIKP